jgi:glycosyltransferase involved in cell wall biosynthesis
MWKLIRCFNTPFWEELDSELREKVQHLVLMPTYKEPIEVLLETISSIANQTVASSIIFVVGMEEKTPEQAEKIRIIKDQYGDAFKALVFTVHPFAIPGEIQGACSNRNWAAREGVKFMIKHKLLAVSEVTKEVDLDFTCVTVCDSDTTFFCRYFEHLTW